MRLFKLSLALIAPLALVVTAAPAATAGEFSAALLGADGLKYMKKVTISNDGRFITANATRGDGDMVLLAKIRSSPKLFGSVGHVRYEPIDVSSLDLVAFAAAHTYGDHIVAAAKRYRVDPRLVAAVIRQESGFQAGATSPVGAMGVMQLMPATARSLSVTDPWDPAQNIAGGTRYLSQLLNSFDNDLTLALAAYNAGPGRVLEHRDVPPFAETRNYVAKISGSFSSARERYLLD